MTSDRTTQDTPGRPNSSSRQQTQAGQGAQSGSPELDARSTGKGPQREVAKKYQDRPADEGKHGDGAEEANPGPLSTDIRDLE